MYLKKIVFLAAFLLMAFSFSISAYAAPDNDQDTFFLTFKIDQGDLSEKATKGSLGLYSVSKDGKSISKDDIEDIDDYKVFVLNKGYSKFSIITFADEKILSGKGDEQTIVGVNVFNVSKNGNVMTSDQSIQKIGASGVYNSSVRLKTGENHIVIAVKKGDLILYRLFKITVKEEKTKDNLENLQINLFQPEKTAPSETKTTQGSMIKQMIESPVNSWSK
ncbi:MAG: hypothetical protein CVU84_15305 [Firmicutes bacterium HGW-Firmicutes-1]|nr:MAG: hypothetical protein CVU84_15305 [Firmicutes bacterium HGW-Firmicutes-1]